MQLTRNCGCKVTNFKLNSIDFTIKISNMRLLFDILLLKILFCRCFLP